VTVVSRHVAVHVQCNSTRTTSIATEALFVLATLAALGAAALDPVLKGVHATGAGIGTGTQPALS
jgi:hypothetical protein